MCTCLCTHVLIHPRFALALGIKEKPLSLILFAFVYLTPFLPFPGRFCLGYLQHAHLIPAIRSDVFLTVTTKDITLPSHPSPVAHPLSAAVPRSCSATPQPPPLPILWGGSLHPHGPSTCPLPQAFIPLPQQEKG